jgi:hypothetical protein
MTALTRLRETTTQPLTGPTVAALANAYAKSAYQVDLAALDALAAVRKPENVAAVTATIREQYQPWLEAGALQLQRLVAEGGWRPGGPGAATLSELAPGTCLLFCDGLRFDLGARLAERLAAEHPCALSWRLAALPTVTATAKPAGSPVADLLAGGFGFESVVARTAERVSGNVLQRLLAERGFQILDKHQIGDPTGLAWTEHGKLDHALHEQGWRVVYRISRQLRSLQTRVENLLAGGWSQVIVCTDHGWLLLPGGLPAAELPADIAAYRKGRCARLRPGATTDYLAVPWHLDPRVEVALAPGISSFTPNVDGDHGGLSPQECVTPVIVVTG